MRGPIDWRDLGPCAYEHGLRVQESVWEARRRGGPDVCLALQHPPTVTLGRRATDADLRRPRTELAARGIACVVTGRGGRATYHGPGQLVVYPIVDLRARGLGVSAFVEMLETVMIEVAARCGVRAWRDERGHGIWAAGGKLGAVGIRVRDHVSTHGLALNVDVDLDAYDVIVPCGLQSAPVTSLAREGATATMAAVLPMTRTACERWLSGVAAEPVAEVAL
jgi:lipoate-protein ligase B